MIKLKKSKLTEIIQNLVYSRYSQLIINEYLKLKKIKVPVHLALGHELIAESISQVMNKDDLLICSHRNIHYHLARGAQLKELIDEYFLLKSGLGQGKCGSMNLINKKNLIIYTSNILANNLPVALGVSLSKKVKNEDGLTIVISGDGAIEEGSFAETIQSAVYFQVPLIIVVENNGWSLASKIEERRKSIDIENLTKSYGGGYFSLIGNKLENYIIKMSRIKKYTLENSSVSVVEVELDTLGNYILKNDENPNGKYINYHSGISPNLDLNNFIIEKNESDPLYQVSLDIGQAKLNLIFQSLKEKFSQFIPK